MRMFIAGVTILLIAGATAGAQDLEPRAYSPSPVGTTFIIISATRSDGGVFTDPSIPIENVDATLGVLGLTLGHTFELLGRQALLLGALPLTWGEASGDVFEERRAASRRGLADPRIRLSMVLAGARPMSPAAFARAPRRSTFGVSVTVAPPTGQYESNKLVNLGSNRWAFKPEIGVSHPAGRWLLDVYGGVWFFTRNHDFYPGSALRQQDPILALQSHLSYSFGRGAWAALNATWYTGGRSSIDGVDKADLQRNTRVGATLSVAVGARQSVKIAYSAGATTRVGADFRTLTAAWQIVLF